MQELRIGLGLIFGKDISLTIAFAFGPNDDMKSSIALKYKCPIAMYGAFEPGVPPASPWSTDAFVQDVPSNFLTRGICVSK